MGAFLWSGVPPYRQGTLFGKYVLGVAGDLVTIQEGIIRINGQVVGPVQESGLGGLRYTPLNVPQEGLVIPKDQLFMGSSHHPYSIDSRYQEVGLLDRHRIIGRMYVLF
ncbi:MAG: hypothetical protein G8345_00710 [Magnetococcales bacterium]|nr:S26 family signal peptidase [Magnetococcales bacterium]NGZ25389.1 hypothetical protein [Magnetococcales bacterium]